MKCSKCHNPTKVKSRKSNRWGYYTRYRECIKCGHKFTSIEMFGEDFDFLMKEKYNLEQLKKLKDVYKVYKKKVDEIIKK